MAKPWRPDLRVYLTGDMALVAGERVIGSRRLPGRQGRVAFAFLVVERGRPVPRGELAEVLWPGSPPRALDAALNAIVSKLRAVLADAGRQRGVLAVESGCYRLELGARAWVDVEAAQRSVHLAEGALLAGDPRRAYGDAVVASAILRRPLLPGDDGDWLDERRQSLRGAFLRSLDCLAEIHAWNGEWPLALRAAEEAVSLEPYRESGYRRLMHLHQAAGNPAEALRAFGRLAEKLERDLGAAPGAETRAVRNAIVSGGPSTNRRNV